MSSAKRSLILEHVCQVPGCEKTFLAKLELEKHNNHVHSSSPSIKFSIKSSIKPSICGQCGKRYNTPRGVIAHFTRAHRDVILAKTVSSPSPPTSPLKLQTSEETKNKSCSPKPCWIRGCVETFQSLRQILAHVREAHGNRKTVLNCAQCDKSLSSAWRLTQHLRLEHGSKVRVKTSPIKVAEDKETNKFVQIEKEDKKKKCVSPAGLRCWARQCPELFSTRSEILIHIRRDHAGSRLRCAECDFEFKTGRAFRKHFKSNHGAMEIVLVEDALAKLPPMPPQFPPTPPQLRRKVPPRLDLVVSPPGLVALMKKNRQYECDKCLRVFRSRQYVRLHQATPHCKRT